WRVSNGSLVRAIQTGHTDRIRSIAYAPNGQFLASGSWDGTVKVWRVADGSLVHTLLGHERYVSSVAFSPDGQFLISARLLGYIPHPTEIKLWRVSDGALLQNYDMEVGSGILSIQFSPDGGRFSYGREDATVVMARVTLRRHDGDVNRDGCVDDADLLAVLFAFGQAGSGLPEDTNDDGVVDDTDLLTVLFNFGSGC
ncbi:MAG: hypothetical protein ACUVV1_01470, partial [Fimbriimonadales bacterium]